MVSEVTAADLLKFLGIDDPDADDVREIDSILPAARSFIYNYTGLSAKEADGFPELEFALKVLAQDMFDNRSRYVDKTTLNQTVESILNLHAAVLL